MRALRNSQRLKRIFYSGPALLLLLMLAFLVLRATWSAYQKETASVAALKETENEWQRLNERNLKLTGSIKRLQTPRGLEEEIREKFSVAREGEKMAVVVGGDNQSEEKKSADKSFFERVLDVLLPWR